VADDVLCCVFCVVCFVFLCFCVFVRSTVRVVISLYYHFSNGKHCKIIAHMCVPYIWIQFVNCQLSIVNVWMFGSVWCFGCLVFRLLCVAFHFTCLKVLQVPKNEIVNDDTDDDPLIPCFCRFPKIRSVVVFGHFSGTFCRQAAVCFFMRPAIMKSRPAIMKSRLKLRFREKEKLRSCASIVLVHEDNSNIEIMMRCHSFFKRLHGENQLTVDFLTFFVVSRES